MRNKIITAEQAAQLVPDGATLGTIGGGGGLVEADTLLAAIETRVLETGAPPFLLEAKNPLDLSMGSMSKRDVLDRMAFAPILSETLGQMSNDCFLT